MKTEITKCGHGQPPDACHFCKLNNIKKEYYESDRKSGIEIVGTISFKGKTEYYGVIIEPIMSVEFHQGIKSEDYEIYGYIIEYKYPDFNSPDGILTSRWESHWKRKIYDSSKDAFDSIIQSIVFSNEKTTKYRDVMSMRFRIRPISVIKNNDDCGLLIRDININRLIL